MSPHALSPGRLAPIDANGDRSSTANGFHHQNCHSIRPRSCLLHTAKDELHDLVCVGFGPASLAIAIALHDTLDGSDKSVDLTSLHGRIPKVSFLEKQDHFAWHSGMLIEGARMQISFIKDMATLRSPRSEFTFLNYLHENGRLVEFTNLSTILPQRVEFEHYLKWCAAFFDDVVEYGEEVVDVVAADRNVNGKKAVDSWIITSRDTRTGTVSRRRTKNVVVATGGQPKIPLPFSSKHPHPRVIHSSQYTHDIAKLLPDRDHDYSIAVIGSGQSAAEVFENLHSRYPSANTNLIIKGAALRPSDDSPFVNDVFNPSRVTPFYSESPSWREQTNNENRCTNYSVVRPELLERLYESLYLQRIKYGNNEANWPHRITTDATVHEVKSNPEDGRIRLLIERPVTAANGKGPQKERCQDELTFDAVILGTGYDRSAFKEILSPLHPLKPGWTEGYADVWHVRRDYSVVFADGAVEEGCGIWLQGCCEDSHGLADTLLSILAVRGGEVVSSMFGGKKHHTSNGDETVVDGVDMARMT